MWCRQQARPDPFSLEIKVVHKSIRRRRIRSHPQEMLAITIGVRFAGRYPVFVATPMTTAHYWQRFKSITLLLSSASDDFQQNFLYKPIKSCSSPLFAYEFLFPGDHASMSFAVSACQASAMLL
jgi:membrane-associated phospholipid phosphatase